MPETDPYESTTERLDMSTSMSSPGSYLVYLFHISAYRFAASRLPPGSRVLDYGCGTGYGSHHLAECGHRVVGVDVSDHAVRYAADHYRSSHLEFLRIAPVEKTPLPFVDASFDAIVSFQVIEHVPSVDSYLTEVARVLKPGGTFICVTPDRATRLFPGQRPWNRWHLEEFSPEGLADAIARHLDVDQVMGMTAPRSVVEIELRRTRLLRVISLPFTFPGAPERWRVAGLEALRRLSGLVGRARSRLGRRPLDRPGRPQDASGYSFGPNDILITREAVPSTNIVLIATRRPKPSDS